MLLCVAVIAKCYGRYPVIRAKLLTLFIAWRVDPGSWLRVSTYIHPKFPLNTRNRVFIPPIVVLLMVIKKNDKTVTAQQKILVQQ